MQHEPEGRVVSILARIHTIKLEIRRPRRFGRHTDAGRGRELLTCVQTLRLY